MKNSMFYLAMALALSGCTVLTVDASKVDSKDGIDQNEAVIIAQMRISQTVECQTHKVGSSVVLSGTNAQAYPDYWFVSFPPKFFSFQRKIQYLVVIDKKNGEIRHASPWNTKEKEDFDWIF